MIIGNIYNKIHKGEILMEKIDVNINISARHVHLSQEHVDVLFGKGYSLNKMKDLYQPGEFAAEEQVVLMANEKKIERVRVLGPIREYTQVEISLTDARTLKISPPVRNSGDIKNSCSITIIGPKGTVNLAEGCIVATRHIHFSTDEAKLYGINNGDIVSVEVDTDKGAILKKVHCKVSDKYKMEMHLDTDDGNALMLSNGTVGKIFR